MRLVHGKKLRGGQRNYFASGHLELFKNSDFVLGEGNMFEKNFDIEVHGRCKIGNKNYFNRNVKLACFDHIEIGDNCLLADSVHMYDHDHVVDSQQKQIKKRAYVSDPIKIGNNVWIGAKATILKGVTIGSGAVIAANSVITRNIPDNTVWGGNPAKFIRSL